MPHAKVCIKETDGKVALTDLDLPDPGPGQALVRTTLTTICGSDIHILDDIPEIPVGMPMGHEAVGVVEMVGDGVERFQPGDRVLSACLLSCGHCAPCRLGEPQICRTLGAPMNLLFGAQSQAFLVSGADHSMTKIPAAVEEFMKLTDGVGVDVAVEALGKQQTFENCCRVTRLGGTVSSVGVYGGISALSLPTDGSFIHRTLVTTLCPTGYERLDYLLRLLEQRKIDPTPMLTHERPLERISEAYEMFRARRDGVIKIAIT